ncbi:hypothetical protein GV828_07925 [Flavobacterium sp. NST-5]|uniref:Uncharacterized protein n=1 Tax=Flavobacterium ichthyis TaxID=2698827 RepID=A0ABW9Z8W9_9FLAO|nr:DUF6090 family protein [Flavobacterium ichthyis]NBL65124.1 hypothetical protein [Flavobacterium ichthyis]
MHDEILKHTRRIKSEMKNTKHTLGEKIKEIFIEILIIGFAVSLSIWLHSWSEHNHQQKEVKEFLMDLKDDLKNDISNISKSKKELESNLKEYQFALDLTQKQIDSLIAVQGTIAFNSSISTTKISNGNYEGFKSSGKIGYIENKTLKTKILKYYQEQSLGLLENEKYNIKTFDKVLNILTDNADKTIDQIIVLPQFKQQLRLQTEQTLGLIDVYSYTLQKAQGLIDEIEQENK